MKKIKNIEEITDSGNEDLADVSGIFYDEEGWNALDEDEGGGTECCGKNMVLAPSGTVYECLKCGGWEYSSS